MGMSLKPDLYACRKFSHKIDFLRGCPGNTELVNNVSVSSHSKILSSISLTNGFLYILNWITSLLSSVPLLNSLISFISCFLMYLYANLHEY